MLQGLGSIVVRLPAAAEESASTSATWLTAGVNEPSVSEQAASAKAASARSAPRPKAARPRRAVVSMFRRPFVRRRGGGAAMPIVGRTHAREKWRKMSGAVARPPSSRPRPQLAERGAPTGALGFIGSRPSR